MMNNRCWYCFLPVLLVFAFLPARALQASPQEALEEIATADNFEDFIKHLPVKVEEHLKNLPAKEKAALGNNLLLHKNLEREGGKLARIDSGNGWQFVEREGIEPTTIIFKNTYISGTDALVELEIKSKNRPETVFIGMRLESGEWRVHQAGRWEKTDLEEKFLPNKESLDRGSSNGTSALSTLRTLNTAIVTYETTYDAQGCPPSLQALSGQENQEPAPDHAMLVDPSFLQEPVVKNGYEFRYVRLDKERYQITATPLQFGGDPKSFFTDDTAVIRSTAESRPANASDPPIE